MTKNHIIYSKEVEAAWFVLKEFIDPFNCSVQYNKKAIPMYYKEVLRHYYSQTKVFRLFGYSKAQLDIHLGQYENHYFRSKRYAEHFSGYGSSDKQAQSLSFAKELQIITKRKKLYGAYVFLLGIDIDAHHNEPDAAELANWIQTTYFTQSYWEPSTNGKGKHGYVKVAYSTHWNLEDVKSVIEEVFTLLQCKIKKLNYSANIDVPCGLPVSLIYNNDVQKPKDLPKISLKDYSKYYHIRDKIKAGEAEVPKFFSAHLSYEEIDKIINIELPVDVDSTQCIKIPRFNYTDISKTNMDDIIFFNNLIYVDFNEFIKLRDELKKKKLELEENKVNENITKKKEKQQDKGGGGGGEWYTTVGSPKGTYNNKGLINSNKVEQQGEVVSVVYTTVSSPKELNNKKSYQDHIEVIKNITNKKARCNKFYFYYADYLGYVPAVEIAINEYCNQQLNTNPDRQSRNRLRRFKVVKAWLDPKWDINRRCWNLADWKDWKDKVIPAAEKKLNGINRTYVKDKKRKQIYEIPVEELAFIYFAIKKSNSSDEDKKSTMMYSFSLKQVKQCLLSQFGKSCHKAKAVRIRQILLEAGLITYVGKYCIGEHGNGYKAVELILEQPKSYSAVVRTVDVFPTRLLINSVIRKGSMFRTIGSLTAEVMSHLSAA